MSSSEFYTSTLDGQPCLRVIGRFRRMALPLPPSPPRDQGPSSCFMCQPEGDAYFVERLHQGRVAILGNAHPVATRSLLASPTREGSHKAAPSTLTAEELQNLFELPRSREFLDRMNASGLDVVAFMNIGTPAAQSKRHPHLQILGFAKEQKVLLENRGQEVRSDLEAASNEGRLLNEGPLRVVVPRWPSMTAEVWAVLPEESADPWGEELRHLTQVCENAISGNYNLILHRDPDLVRVVPRGLSERAGLEFSCANKIQSVVAASIEETVELWQRALANR